MGGASEAGMGSISPGKDCHLRVRGDSDFLGEARHPSSRIGRSPISIDPSHACSLSLQPTTPYPLLCIRFVFFCLALLLMEYMRRVAISNSFLRFPAFSSAKSFLGPPGTFAVA